MSRGVSVGCPGGGGPRLAEDDAAAEHDEPKPHRRLERDRGERREHGPARGAAGGPLLVEREDDQEGNDGNVLEEEDAERRLPELRAELAAAGARGRGDGVG